MKNKITLSILLSATIAIAQESKINKRYKTNEKLATNDITTNNKTNAIQENVKIILADSTKTDAKKELGIVKNNSTCIDSTYNRVHIVCAGESLNVGNNTYNISGTYTDSLTTTNNCDSIIITTLTVRQLPILSISCSNPTATKCAGSMDTLIVTGNAVSYQWSNNEINDTIFFTYNFGDTNVISVIGYDSIGCTNSATYTLRNVVPLLTNFIVITEISDSLCITDSARVLNFATGNGLWSGTGIIGNKFDPTVAGVGTFAITYIETFTCGVNGIQANVRVDECIVGLNKLTIANATISPNPNNGTFSITTPTYGTYTIVNELGQTIYTFTTTASASTVNISGLASGVYVVKNTTTATHQKIVVSN